MIRKSCPFLKTIRTFRIKYEKRVLLWIEFLDQARKVFMLLYATKTNNLMLFEKSMGDMAPLFFSMGGHNYSKFLTWFDLYPANIEITHPCSSKLLEAGAISVARSLISGNLSMIDKTMEETLMLFGKCISTVYSMDTTCIQTICL